MTENNSNEMHNNEDLHTINDFTKCFNCKEENLAKKVQLLRLSKRLRFLKMRLRKEQQRSCKIKKKSIINF